jgi:hypothetical protein
MATNLQSRMVSELNAGLRRNPRLAFKSFFRKLMAARRSGAISNEDAAHMFETLQGAAPIDDDPELLAIAQQACFLETIEDQFAAEAEWKRLEEAARGIRN